MQKRKLIYLICFYFLVLSLLGGCEKQSLQMGVAEKTGIQRAKGVPAGAPVTRQIDVAGGTIFSDDGRTELIIPPGALSDPITISIQTINSTLPLSLAGAYRLEPEGLQFEQPVTIRIHYTDEQVANSSPEILFIGYQDPSDVWRALKDSHVDMDSKTISASISHFSDWTVFEEYSLSASSNAVSPGETSNLHVIRNGFLDGDAFEYILSDTSSNWLAPLDDMGKVENWQLLGQGNLSSVKGFATYTAPASVPVPNPIHVSVDVLNVFNNNRSKGKLTLITPITVEDEYMSMSIGSKTYTTQIVNSTVSSISSVGGGASVNITTGSLHEGSYSFGNISGTTALVAVMLDSLPAKPYGIFYFTGCPDPVAAQTTGTFIITQFGLVGQYMEGSFSGTLVSSVNCDNEFQPVTGSFRVKR